ncbi:MAG: hypothetical protein AAF480_15170 [Actinomycetota bacterium]
MRLPVANRPILTLVAVIVAVIVLVTGCTTEPTSLSTSAPREEDRTETAEAREHALEFEMVTALIDDEWEVEASIPTGWHIGPKYWGELEVVIRDFDENDRRSGQPGDEASIFTTMVLDTGCQGTCAPTDWEERLNGPEGYLTERRGSKDLMRDEALADGWIQVELDGGDIEVEVLRWHDEAPRYLKCELDIDDDDVHLLDSFIEACVSTNPRWFPS